jgi:DNA polymerase III subunit gamma/tau
MFCGYIIFIGDHMEQFSIKFRPRSFKDIYGQPTLVQDLSKRAKINNWPKSMLLRGQYGTGKTTAAHIIAMTMQCEHLDEEGNPCLECSSCKSILSERFDRDTMMLDGGQIGQKDSVIEFTSILNVRPMYDKRRVFIIEEADQLSSGAINALLKILESPKENVHFILLSMQQGGIPPAIVSRCQVFNFKPVGITDTMLCMRDLLQKANIWDSLPKDFQFKGLSHIAQISQGSLRTALQHLEKAVVGEYFTPELWENEFAEVSEVTTYKIVEGLLNKSKDDALWASIYKADPSELYNYITLILADVMIFKQTGFLKNEAFGNSTKMLASKPLVDSFFNIMATFPPFSKPYVRKADLLAALALYYLDNKPSEGLKPPTKEDRPQIPIRRVVR